jgi:hypothetical protein
MSEPLISTFACDSTGDWAVPVRIITGNEAVAQILRHKFQFFFKEWALDQRLGVPYYENILKKGPNLRVVRGIFRQVLLKTKGVSAIKTFELSVDSATRGLSLNFEIVLSGGTIFRSQPDQFIITFPI